MDVYEHADPKLIYIFENIPTFATATVFEEQFCDGCGCSETCKPDNCKCLLRRGALYNQAPDIKNYTIVLSDAYNPIYECNDNCKCKRFCGNRLVQYGPRRDLQIQKCKAKGLGLITTKNVHKGNFICEYAGEVITKEEAVQRHTFNKEHKLMNYIICVNENFGDKCTSTFIDPSVLGNIGRYLNHSCEPNCDLFVIRINNTVPKVCIFAKEDISAGCELTFDYGITSSNTNTKMQEELVKCMCESTLCGGFMPFHSY